MNITLTPELEQFVQTQIDSGKYASATEVLLAGVALLKEIDRVYKGRFEELRQKVLDGVDAADRGDVIDSETVFENLQAKLEQKRYQGQ
ncbi:type II toxin-antitoxin system ParD family antitoxin [Leptothoe spongobia]|uniref:Type II toxin-antitoxin system ParD family antitoxin n=1 Tax=Leptothoe spongobia TAU-MAC 1115 TaxID=1967444 RepID=A0A947DFJ3_9CYAN|nr:type II toxin-antitoxin system ParD family antitoxin [Leptothoe spongobia]MBT9316112.1 type II toxin-antitoxin system ParD family antitoxin [Leptothoe spongobia TAU-MAC 1115]